MGRIYLARHGRTAWNAEGRYLGHTDLPLDEQGMREARGLAARLAKVRFAAAYCSDLQRVRQTADLILEAGGGGGRPIPDRRLREASFGSWEGMTYAGLAALPEAAAWLLDPAGAAPPGGESLAEVAARVSSFYQEAAAGLGGEEILVVTHGGPARIMICLALGLDPSLQWRFKIDPGGLAVLDLHGRDAALSGLYPGGTGSG
ncbi:MAG: histidine phosphatase family protein [Patescibacteria group bacterium]